MASMVHRIFWSYGRIERVVFDPVRPPKAGEIIRTYEYWPEEDKSVPYNTEVVDFRANEDGSYQLKLAYLLKNNPEFPEMCTGQSTIEVQKNRKQAKATFASDPQDDDLDGEVKCTVSQEDEARILEYETITRIKRQQTEFKKQILEHGNCCEITGETMEAVLQAAHIVEVKNQGNDTASNGILLRCDLHQLYDGGMFAIEPDGSIRIIGQLSEHYTSLLKNAKLKERTLQRVGKALHLRTESTTDW